MAIANEPDLFNIVDVLLSSCCSRGRERGSVESPPSGSYCRPKLMVKQKKANA